MWAERCAGKVLKDRRSPRRRGRMGTSVTRTHLPQPAGLVRAARQRFRPARAPRQPVHRPRVPAARLPAFWYRRERVPAVPVEDLPGAVRADGREEFAARRISHAVGVVGVLLKGGVHRSARRGSSVSRGFIGSLNDDERRTLWTDRANRNGGPANIDTAKSSEGRSIQKQFIGQLKGEAIKC